MKEEDVEIAIKVVIVGNGAVGKSSMIQRYCKGIFTKDYKKTIGVDFLERQLQIKEEDVRLMLWDTAGQEEFDAITKSYYRGAQAGVVVFSTVDRASFEAVEKWKRKVEDEVDSIPLVLVQNKIDLVDEAVIAPEEAEALAKRLKLRFYRASVKENLNVDEVFLYLTDKYMQKLQSQEAEDNATTNPKIGIFNTTGPPPNGGGGGRDSKNTSEESQTIKLRPTKQRTKGKKQPFKCLLL